MKTLDEIVEENWIVKNSTNLKTIAKQIAIQFGKQLIDDLKTESSVLESSDVIWNKYLIDENTKIEEKKEIVKLIKEADERGFKKGTFYVTTRILEDNSIITHEEIADHRAEHFYTYPDERGITLYCGQSQGCIYIRGKWAKIIKQTK